MTALKSHTVTSSLRKGAGICDMPNCNRQLPSPGLSRCAACTATMEPKELHFDQQTWTFNHRTHQRIRPAVKRREQDE